MHPFTHLWEEMRGAISISELRWAGHVTRGWRHTEVHCRRCLEFRLLLGHYGYTCTCIFINHYQFLFFTHPIISLNKMCIRLVPRTPPPSKIHMNQCNKHHKIHHNHKSPPSSSSVSFPSGYLLLSFLCNLMFAYSGVNWGDLVTFWK